MKARTEQHNGITYLTFKCPGCETLHQIIVAGSDRAWGWNGSHERPTITPSVLCWLEHRADEDEEERKYVDSRRCHSFVRDGRIEFLGDCGHKLAGQTVDLPELEGVE